MKHLKRLAIIIIVLLSIQTITYFAFSKNLLIQEIGKNNESYALGYKENTVHNLGVFSEMQPSQQQIKDNFKHLKPHEFAICTSVSEFRNIRTKEHHFLYYFNNTTRNPFSINVISEYEGA